MLHKFYAIEELIIQQRVTSYYVHPQLKMILSAKRVDPSKALSKTKQRRHKNNPFDITVVFARN